LGLDEICHMLMEFVSTNWILDWKYSYEVDWIKWTITLLEQLPLSQIT
jgi:hypothetical protein